MFGNFIVINPRKTKSPDRLIQQKIWVLAVENAGRVPRKVPSQSLKLNFISNQNPQKPDKNGQKQAAMEKLRLVSSLQ